MSSYKYFYRYHLKTVQCLIRASLTDTVSFSTATNRGGKHQKLPYFFPEDHSCILNNSCFLHSPITWMLIPGAKYQYNNFSFQSWPPNESVTSAGPLKRAPKIQQLIKRMSVSTLPHTQHLVSQMFTALSHTANQAMSRAMWLTLEARSDPMTQELLHRSSRLNLLLIYASFYLI